MDLLIKRKSDGEVFKVWKYVLGSQSQPEEHIWCNDWYGHHIIGVDCEWIGNESNLPSNVEIYEEAKRVSGEVKMFRFDPVSFQFGAEWMRDLIKLPAPLKTDKTKP